MSKIANLKSPASPFPGPAKTSRRISHEIDPDHLIVEHNVPVPKRTIAGVSKYAKVFAALRPGSCIKCMPDEVPVIANALRNSIESNQFAVLAGCTVASRRNCADGTGMVGRVWVKKK